MYFSAIPRSVCLCGRCGAQGMGGFLMLEYQKSSAAHTLRTAGLGERDN